MIITASQYSADLNGFTSIRYYKDVILSHAILTYRYKYIGSVESYGIEASDLAVDKNENMMNNDVQFSYC